MGTGRLYFPKVDNATEPPPVPPVVAVLETDQYRERETPRLRSHKVSLDTRLHTD